MPWFFRSFPALFAIVLAASMFAPEPARADYCSIAFPCSDGYSCNDPFVGSCERDAVKTTSIGTIVGNEAFSTPVAGAPYTSRFPSPGRSQQRCPAGQAIIGFNFVRTEGVIAGYTIKCMGMTEQSRWSGGSLWESAYVGSPSARALTQIVPANTRDIFCAQDRFVTTFQANGDFDYVFKDIDTEGVKVFCSLRPGERLSLPGEPINYNLISSLTAGEFHSQDEADSDRSLTFCPADHVATGMASLSDSDKIENFDNLVQWMLICQRVTDIVAASQSSIPPRSNDGSPRRQMPPPAPSARIPAPPTGVTAGLPVPGIVSASACRAYLNGPNQWTQSQVTVYPADVADAICAGAENSPKPGECFHYVASGLVAFTFEGVQRTRPNQWSRWSVPDIVHLCRGSTSGAATADCFHHRLSVGNTQDEAWQTCASHNANAVSPVLMPYRWVGLSSSLNPAESCTAADWIGSWMTNYGQMHLADAANDGVQFIGTYGPQNHNIRGVLRKSPCRLEGIWIHNGNASRGQFRFVQSTPGSFQGAYSDVNTDPATVAPNWTGNRN